MQKTHHHQRRSSRSRAARCHALAFAALVLALGVVAAPGLARTPTPTPPPTVHPSYTPTPTCHPGQAWHIPWSTDTCQGSGDTMRRPYQPQIPGEPVCLYVWVLDTEPIAPTAVRYRINGGPWLTQGLSWICFPQYRNTWWTYCSDPDSWWLPDAGPGDRVEYYIVLLDYTSCTHYLHGEWDPAQTSDEAVAQADPFYFEYPSITPSPTPPFTLTPEASPSWTPCLGLTSTPTPSPSVTPSVTPSCIPETAWLERVLPASCRPGQAFDVELEIRGGSAEIVRVVETVPAGWQVLSPAWDERDGDTYTWERGITGYRLEPPDEAAPGIYQFAGETVSYHWCNGEITLAITGDAEIELLPGITPTTPPVTPSPTPRPTSVPSETPLPCCTPEPTPAAPWLQLVMPDRLLQAGDRFLLQRLCGNPGPISITVEEYCILDVYGRYWFYPSWSRVPRARGAPAPSGQRTVTDDPRLPLAHGREPHGGPPLLGRFPPPTERRAPRLRYDRVGRGLIIALRCRAPSPDSEPGRRSRPPPRAPGTRGPRPRENAAAARRSARASAPRPAR